MKKQKYICRIGWVGLPVVRPRDKSQDGLLSLRGKTLFLSLEKVLVLRKEPPRPINFFFQNILKYLYNIITIQKKQNLKNKYVVLRSTLFYLINNNMVIRSLLFP
jgi:hypothetical protein